jgi:general transcription factor IIIA
MLDPVIYNCHVCQQSFGKWTELRKHTLTDHPIQCTVCNKTYTKPYALKIHIKEKHAKQFKVECEWPGCGSVLATVKENKMLDYFFQLIP